MRVTSSLFLAFAAACSPSSTPAPAADLILHNARAYTLAWPDPFLNGHPSPEAPYDSTAGWHPYASAIAIRDGRIIFVGNDSAALTLKGPTTKLIDLAGHVLLPGLVDAHTHVAELGQSLDRVNLTGIATEEEAVERIVARAAQTPKGEWILGFGVARRDDVFAAIIRCPALPDVVGRSPLCRGHRVRRPRSLHWVRCRTSCSP